MSAIAYDGILVHILTFPWNRMLFWIIVGTAVLLLWYCYRSWNDMTVPNKFPHAALHPVSGAEFDMIVVGAGAASSAFLHYVQEHYPPEKSILVIESGTMGDLPEKSHAAGLWTECIQDSAIDHGLETVPQRAVNNRTYMYGRGRGKGGSTLLNAMMWVLGSPLDWDQQGFKEWAWEHVHPHFKAMESYPEGDPEFRGHQGPIQVRDVSTKSKALNSLIKQVGMKDKVDYNQHQEGSFTFCQQNNTASGRRINPFDALVDVSGISIIDTADVQRVLFDDSKRATGVQVRLQSGKIVTIKSRERIVLCAGAIATPHILLHSGVGPKEHLQSHGIPVVADLPVGSELIDHAGLPVSVVLKERVEGDGSGLDLTGFWTSEWAKKHEPERGPDLQYVAGGGQMVFGSAASQLAWKITQKFALSRFFARLLRRTLIPLLKSRLERVVYLAPVLNHPRSRGTIRLSSADPRHPPLIDLGLLTDPADMERFVAAAKTVRATLSGWSMFKEFVDKDILSTKTDKQYEEYVKRHLIHGWHVASSTPMGKVVDHKTLQVIGCTGVCVADISIMTDISSGNTMIPAMLCGRRGAELILNSL